MVDKGIYYVGIEAPKSLRREVLSSSRSLVIMLKKYEQIKNNRREKIELLSMLNKTEKDIAVLVGGLRKLFPETKIRQVMHMIKPREEEDEPEPEPARPRPKKVPVKRHMTELEKLERELDAIEHKLHKVN
ncbi:hypothetical protein H6504_03150 [Candidatus Woesearchaeota archaeon]|nr:hypothetical protein [Candidatus Woesearchaeota archaeon]